MTTWKVQATAKDVRAVMADPDTLQIPEPAAALIAALIVAVGDEQSGIPDDAQVQLAV